MTQLQELLSEREYLVISSLQQGMKPEKIAEEFNISRNAVDQARYRAKQKLGEELFSKILAPVPNPRERCVQNSRDLEDILTPTELRVFLSLKRSQKSWEMVAEEARTTPECARKLVPRIKKKLGEKYDKLISHSTSIEGVVTFQEPRKENEQSKCENCHHFYCSIVSKKGKKVFCSQHKSKIFNGKRERCGLYEEYIRVDRNSDIEKLNEALKDKNFLRMAFKAGTGYEPKDGIEKSQYAIAGLGFTGYHFRRRAQARAILGASARYTVVALTDEERGRPEVKEILKHLKLSPTKLDFDEDYTTAHYVIKDHWSYQQLMAVLSGDVDFVIGEEGTVTIFFEYETRIKHIAIREKNSNKRQVIKLDSPGIISKEHTAEFPFNPGIYIISLRVGSGLAYNYEITVDNKQGRTQITKCILA